MDGEEKIHELIVPGDKEEILRTKKPNEEIVPITVAVSDTAKLHEIMKDRLGQGGLLL